MRIRFDGTQEYQLDAITSVTDLFDGQPLAAAAVGSMSSLGSIGLFDGSELGYGNHLSLDEEMILSNLQSVQDRSGLPVSERLEGMHFAVEMETGTGKTYVYLRTIFELHRLYGFTKFIVVVPSVAIREGVTTAFRLMRDHLRTLYEGTPVDFWVYESARVSRLRQFALSDQLQILVINIDAFNKPQNNVIYRPDNRMSDYAPLDFVKASRPVVVVDEPQLMESDQAREAIAAFEPMCTLRYSATHRLAYNPVYRLDPVRAYELGLVKQIEVDSVTEEGDLREPYLKVVSVTPGRRTVTAKVSIDARATDGPPIRKVVSLRSAGQDLLEITGLDRYEGYVVDHMDAGAGYVAFTNGAQLSVGDQRGGHTDQVMQAQVYETVKQHLEKQLIVGRSLPGEQLKVLSLFFIDRVANYLSAEGKIRQWFVEAYEDLTARERYASLRRWPVESVHAGYFATVSGAAVDTSGTTAADDEAYRLIMRDKEGILDPAQPLQFIFSHSALREGWDNPNIFQICTLNETRSPLRMRQEIGRGLRLPVLASGDRCFDRGINRLTVIANERYEEFARTLQEQIREDFGVEFGSRVHNARLRRTAQLQANWETDPDFLALWDLIKHRTRYSVAYNSGELINRAAALVRAMKAVEPPKITTTVVRLELTDSGIAPLMLSSRSKAVVEDRAHVPDLLSFLQRETELTRSTLAEILVASERLADAAVNPQQFLDQTLRAVKVALEELMIDGIRYERIEGIEWEMRLFESAEIVGYANRMVEVNRSIYDALELESGPERTFAAALDNRDDIRLFIKLPRWFRVETPIGTYNPDWAIVKEEESLKLYLVRETKSTRNEYRLRQGEWAKIRCGMAHFSELDVDFDFAANPAAV